MAKGWDIWEEYEWEDGFYIDRLEVESHHTIVFYNFPEVESVFPDLVSAIDQYGERN